MRLLTRVYGSIADPLLAGEKPAYRLYRSMPARMYGPDVQERPKNEQIISLSVVATHSWPVLLGI